MKFIKAVVNYAKENTFHTALLIALAVVIVIMIVAIVCASKKRARARTELLLAEAESSAVEQATPTTEPAPIAEQPTAQIVEEPIPAPVKTEKQPAKAKTAPKAKPVKAEDEPTISTTVKPLKGQAKSNPVKSATKKSSAKKSKEDTMLLDELKDATDRPDFYEEDETDKQAKYTGKWVICRVVTDDEKDEEETYFFELHASNGEKLLSSEEYTSYNGALRGIETHRTNILKNNFRITISKKGDYIFKLLSGKNQLLCMGEHYATRARCESAIESAKRFAKTAVLDENVQYQVVKLPQEDDHFEPLPDGYNGKWVIDSTTAPDGEEVFYFELYANNGERLLSSEEYASYIGAVNGINTHKMNIAKGNFRIFLTKQGDYIYKLLNGNGQLLCLGEHYKTKRRCLNAVESVKRFALNSPVLTDSKHTN